MADRLRAQPSLVDTTQAGGGPLIANGVITEVRQNGGRAMFTIVQRGSEYRFGIDLSTARITVTPEQITIADG